ncbi:ACP S-malonyltransferase [Marinobacterium sediminicola]|uniref:Malonyl CoA-acyl carrier protein transacylase n=1 Tax=Marinobacterium sediminicola TaxID=518898 RepID=A0ABY1RXV0_9GAMM|nr:ACP S-malonyltransferase [Marinobacterium sediminicola]ULG67714.1 ACP S-malonyltransferase [Marinobacterium sediminicola]SMR71646.1 [acyl-carrier-protein] S-malonyltransferase [Marinobacterium sediminicola]
MSQTLAFVFPGQGSQQLGMLSELAAAHPIIEQTFAEASDALGFDLWKMTQEGPEEALNSTENTQPALLTAGVALWRLWQEQGGAKPSVMAGHSLGEYTALVCAGALSLADGVRLVKLRGEYMQQAVPAGSGAMAAILGLDDDAIAKACEDAAQGGVVSPVNYNCPGQVVIAGEKAAVERGIEACKAAGAKRAVPLPVSVPSHCALMKPAAEKLAEALGQIDLQQPEIPVVQNVAASVADDLDMLRDNLVAQLYSPVLWTASVQKIASEGSDTLIECGPGKVLTGLIKKIDRSLNGVSISDPAGLEKALG